jgi:anti-sigma factor RsiW
MADLDRVVGSIRCRDVLACLSDYVDGGLTQVERAAVETHVRGCDQCARFGGRFALIVAALRGLASDAGGDMGRRERLRARLARDLTG